MNVKLPLIVALMASVLTLHAEDWTIGLVNQNPGVIEKVVKIKPSLYCPSYLTSYWIYYRQPLLHDEPELGDFQLRAMLTIRNKEDFTNQMTQVNIGGYGLGSDMGRYPNYYADYFFTESGGELAGRYNGNLLQPEHRYFGKSIPEAPWSTLGYCEAKEAAADFHNLIEALKKVFKGKWAISGVSKGGTTTAIQQAYYPNDADCFVPYSGPFLDFVHDTRMQERWMTEAWTPELRDYFLHIQKEMLNRSQIYKMYREYYDWGGSEYDYWDSLLRCYMLSTVALFDADLHAYSSRLDVINIVEINENYLQNHELQDFTDEMLLYMLVKYRQTIDEQYDKWYAETFVSDNSDNKACIRLDSEQKRLFEQRLPLPVFGISETDWSDGVSYWYQAAHELGYLDLKYDFFYDTQEEADSVNAMWQNETVNAMMLANETFADVEFNPELMETVYANTSTATVPMLFIYGNDDIWTGACMPSACVNDENVRQYILPEQNHGVSISHVEDLELRDELWAFTDAIFKSGTEAISMVKRDAESAPAFYDLWGRKIDASQVRNRIVIKR